MYWRRKLEVSIYILIYQLRIIAILHMYPRSIAVLEHALACSVDVIHVLTDHALDNDPCSQEDIVELVRRVLGVDTAQGSVRQEWQSGVFQMFIVPIRKVF